MTFFISWQLIIFRLEARVLVLRLSDLLWLNSGVCWLLDAVRVYNFEISFCESQAELGLYICSESSLSFKYCVEFAEVIRTIWIYTGQRKFIPWDVSCLLMYSCSSFVYVYFLHLHFWGHLQYISWVIHIGMSFWSFPLSCLCSLGQLLAWMKFTCFSKRKLEIIKKEAVQEIII